MQSLTQVTFHESTKQIKNTTPRKKKKPRNAPVRTKDHGPDCSDDAKKNKKKNNITKCVKFSSDTVRRVTNTIHSTPTEINTLFNIKPPMFGKHHRSGDDTHSGRTLRKKKAHSNKPPLIQGNGHTP